MAGVEWGNDCSIRLMQEYKKRPQLWDTTHEFYRVQTAKYEAWSELADIFECDIADLRKKLNSLFASHRREKGKIRSGGISSWFLYPHMNFLPSHVPNEKLLAAENSYMRSIRDSDGSDDDNMEEECMQETIVKTEPAYEPKPIKRRLKYKPQRAKLVRTVKRRIEPPAATAPSNSLDSKLVECLRLLKRSETSTRKDDCDSFGEYIADSLRKHDDRTQSMIKQAINNILFEQEMKKYSAGQYAVVISSEVEENPLILGDEPNN